MDLSAQMTVINAVTSTESPRARYNRLRAARALIDRECDTLAEQAFDATSTSEGFFG